MVSRKLRKAAMAQRRCLDKVRNCYRLADVAPESYMVVPVLSGNCNSFVEHWFAVQGSDTTMLPDGMLPET